MTAGLPRGWALTKIGALGKYINGRGFGKAEWKTRGLPIIRIQNLNDETAAFNYSDAEHEQKYRVRNGDLLVAWAASLGVYIWNGGAAWLNQHIFRVEVEERLVSKPFLYYSLKHALEALYKKTHGSGMVHVTKDRFDSHPIKLPPLKEQGRIVSKIEELFSRIEEGERALERVQTLVERYRQSVLKAAVTGELTREWREKHQGQLESGEALLRHILKVRREAWEKAELAVMKVKGVRPPNDSWKQKYHEPTEPKIAVQQRLPRLWAQLSVEQATLGERPVAYGVLQPGKDLPSGVPLVRVCDVADGAVDTKSLKRISQEIAEEFPRTKLRGGEVLLTIVGTIGRTAIVPAELAGANVARAVAVMVPTEGVMAEWLELCLRYEKTRQVLTEAAREVARKTLNLEQLRECAIPVPSAVEQQEAVSRVGILLSRASAIERDIKAQIRGATALRQTVMRAAFSGLLVRQEPTDEPASSMLDRFATDDGRARTAPSRGRKNMTEHAA
jgi:type I restriction enzyme, S subunit